MIVYLDETYLVHKDYEPGYRKAEHPFFDGVPEKALECYKFIPEYNFIQCIDTAREHEMSMQSQIAELNSAINIITNGYE